MTPEFVAEARRVYVPAARWMRANGMKLSRHRGPHGWSICWALGSEPPQIVAEPRGSLLWQRIDVWPDSPSPKMILYPKSIQQAVDLIVAAGILPASFHSLSRKAPERWCQHVEDPRYGIHCGLMPADPVTLRCRHHESGA